MKIERTCKTCEYNFQGDKKNQRICANEHYGETITDFKTERECWTIGLDYFMELRNLLSQEEKKQIDNNVKEDSNKLLFRIIENK